MFCGRRRLRGGFPRGMMRGRRRGFSRRLTRRLRRLLGGFSRRLPRRLRRLLGGFVRRLPGGVVRRLLRGTVRGARRLDARQTDRRGIVGKCRRAAVSENLHVGDIDHGHVLAESIGSIPVEIVPVVDVGVFEGSVTDAVCLVSGAGTGTASIGRLPSRNGGSWGISTGTLTGLVRPQISFADDGVAVDGIRRVLEAHHQECISFERDVCDDRGAVPEGSEGPGRNGTIDRIAVGRT